MTFAASILGMIENVSGLQKTSWAFVKFFPKFCGVYLVGISDEGCLRDFKRGMMTANFCAEGYTDAWRIRLSRVVKYARAFLWRFNKKSLWICSCPGTQDFEH